MNKKEIRIHMRNKREQLDNLYINQASDKILKNIIDAGLLENYRSMLSYMDFKNEVKTEMLNKYFSKFGKIYLPKVIDKENMVAIEDKGNYYISKFGNKEPIGEIYTGAIDAIIVPGVAFDRYGNRIGFGRGYYDRFFLKYPNAMKIAIAFEIQLTDEKIETEEFDKKIDVLVTEKNIYNFKE